MKTTPTLISLGLLALSCGAQAATWTLGGDAYPMGWRLAYIEVDGHHVDTRELSGGVGEDLYDITPTYIAAGSWRSFTADWGDNAIDIGLSHEAYVQTSVGGDPSVASALLMTSAQLQNATISQPPTYLRIEAETSVRHEQDFILTPELGEAIGMPVFVTVFLSTASYDTFTYTLGTRNHSYSGSYSAAIYLNGDFLTWVGGSGTFTSHPLKTFVANLGDTVTVEMDSYSRINADLLSVLALPDAMADSRIDVKLSISPIPEPETWAMLLAGLGLVGLQLRRKPRINHKLEI